MKNIECGWLNKRSAGLVSKLHHEKDQPSQSCSFYVVIQMKKRTLILNDLWNRRRKLEKALIKNAFTAADKKWIARLLSPPEIHYTESVIDRLRKELLDQEGISKSTLLYCKAILASMSAETRLMSGSSRHIDADDHTTDLIEAYAEFADTGEKFVEPKQTRTDALGEAMINSYKKFIKENGRPPKPLELWNYMPEDGTVQEKEQDERIIYWKKRNGNEKTTSYKSFQNRFLGLRKKLKKKSR